MGKRIARFVGRTPAFRFAVFAALLSIHAFRRIHVPSITRSEQRLTPLKYYSLSLTRFMRGLGADVRPHCQTYICQRNRIAKTACHVGQLAHAPRFCAWLYFANVQKIQGFFDDSEFLYRELATKPTVRDIALRGLGDLLGMQAIWASEFEAYASGGIALNVFKALKKNAHGDTWHDRTFTEAIAVMTEAVQSNVDNADGWWLLAYINTLAGRSQAALDADYECSARSVITFEERFSNAARTFAVDQARGALLYETALESWSGWWQVADVGIVKAAELQSSEGTRYFGASQPSTLSIDTHVVLDQQVVPVQTTLNFDASYVAEYDYAEILPQYGMILANRKHLIADSAHMKLIHVPLFYEAVRAISADRALIAGRTALQYPKSDCIYIGHNKNYYHWLVDELPRLSLLQQVGKYADLPILVDTNAPPWQIKLLHRLGIDHSRLRAVDFTEPLAVDRLIVPSHLSTDMVAHPEAVRFIRNGLVKDADRLAPRAGKRLYLSRRSQKGRAILNEASVVRKFKKAGFSIVDTGQLSIDQQIDLFADAEVIAGPGGAALTNALFAPRDAKVISLTPTSVTCHTFTSISAALGQGSWVLNGASYARPHPWWIWSMFDFEIDERDIDLCFQNTL